MPLRSKARKNSEAVNRASIYFSAHPDDFHLYFEKITNDILNIVDCVIYYYDSKEDREANEDYTFNLSQMQMFVFPITSNFLLYDNPSRNVDFAFAIENNIPVLPILMEDQLADLFNSKCGNLHLLDNVNQNHEQNYQKKLASYLEALLSGDDVIDKINAAFRGQIFLSYRKKDRTHAQRLMQVIHSNPRLRDIAIWYDEFLNPGEDFNYAIKDEIEKSDVFVLAITPNIFENGNYVLSVEYPMAKSMNKNLLPVEIVTTDPDNFRECFTSLIKLISIENEETIFNTIIEALPDRKEFDDSGIDIHEFLIGLAYLKGIKVEINRKLALSLIEKSADSGNLDAIKMLADMYHYGNAVEQDFFKEIHWLKKLIKTFEQKENLLDDANALQYAAYLSRISDRLVEIDQFESGSDILKRYYHFAKEATDKFCSAEMMAYYAESCELYSSVNFTGKRSFALIKEALDVRRKIAEQHPSDNAYVQLSKTYLAVVEHSKFDSDKEDGRFYYESAVQVLERYDTEDAPLNCRRQLAYALEQCVIYLLERKDNDRTYLMRAVQLYEKIEQKTADLVDALNSVNFFSRLIKVMTSVASDDENPIPEFVFVKVNSFKYTDVNVDDISSNIQLFSTYLNILFGIARQKSDLRTDDAVDVIKWICDVANKYIEKTNSRFVRARLADLYDNIAVLLWRVYESYEEAKSYYLKKIDVLTTILNEVENLMVSSDISVTYQFLSMIAEEEGNASEAEYYRQKGMEFDENTDWDSLWKFSDD